MKCCSLKEASLPEKNKLFSLGCHVWGAPISSFGGGRRSDDKFVLSCAFETLFLIFSVAMAGLMSSAGAYMSRLWKRDPNYARVCLLGPGDAGKTTLLYRLVLGETVTTIPTMGFYCECCNSVPLYSGTVK